MSKEIFQGMQSRSELSISLESFLLPAIYEVLEVSVNSLSNESEKEREMH